jgi:hypothetical protein
MKIKTLYRWLLIAVVGLCPLLIPQPASARSVTITLTIAEVLQIDNVDDTRPGEFYATVAIGNGGYWTTDHAEDMSRVFPNWTFRHGADAAALVPIVIEIRDHDWPDPDDKCDVSPTPGRKTLRINYNVATGQISGDVNGVDGELLSATGAGDSDRVRIRFRVTQSPAPPPPAIGIHNGDTADQAPPPPAIGIHSSDTPDQASCGEVQITRVEGEYERSSIGTLPCPRIDSVAPQTVYPGDGISIRGDHFGDESDQIGSSPGEKRLLIIPLLEGGGHGNPTPINLEIWSWSQQSIQAGIPRNLNPGQYQLAIFYPLIPGSHRAFGQVSNVVTVNVLDH